MWKGRKADNPVRNQLSWTPRKASSEKIVFKLTSEGWIRQERTLKRETTITCREPEKINCGWRKRWKMVLFAGPRLLWVMCRWKMWFYLKSLKESRSKIDWEIYQASSKRLRYILQTNIGGGGTWKTALKQLPSTSECPWPGTRGKSPVCCILPTVLCVNSEQRAHLYLSMKPIMF